MARKQTLEQMKEMEEKYARLKKEYHEKIARLEEIQRVATNKAIIDALKEEWSNTPDDAQCDWNDMPRLIVEMYRAYYNNRPNISDTVTATTPKNDVP